MKRYVEGAHRLVEHDQLGLEGEGPGDGDALELATGELARVALGDRRAQAHELEQLTDPLASRRRPVDHLVGAQRLGDRLAHRREAVERRVRVLEDALGLATHAEALATTEARRVDAVDQHAAGRRVLEAESDPAEGRLAGAGLADQTEGLAAVDAEADVVDRLHPADGATQESALAGELHPHLAELEHGAHGLATSRSGRSSG
jgi:hypothetical protein